MKAQKTLPWWKSETARLVGVIIASLAIGGFILSKVWILPEIPPLETKTQPNPKTTLYPVTIGTSVIQAEIRKTEAEQALGLSWRSSLGAEEGMVFIYPSPRPVMYWMKGMQFPLDFLWIARGKVVQISEDVPAPVGVDKIPKTIVPTTDVDMVIEVNAGWAARHGVMVGDMVRIEK